GNLKLDGLRFMVLDEADEMLNMGFIEDVEEILASTPKERRMLLFSATMPDRIRSLSKKYMRDTEMVSVKKEALTTNLTDQIYFEVNENDKFEALCRIIDVEEDFYGLVFCRTKLDVDHIAHKLGDRGYATEGLHGDISQAQREKILGKFKKKTINVLIATDVAARGIDINNLTHVINFSLPQDPESYVHRIGRTGRAGKMGTAITFVSPSEYRKLTFIKKFAQTDIRREKLPNVQDVINIKKSRLKNEVSAIIEGGEFKEYLAIAKELMAGAPPEDAIAALLKYAFQGELDEKNYNEIRETREVSVDKKGKARLFVALGKVDGMSPKKIVDFIQRETNVKTSLIQDVGVFDQFSFITVPFKEGELILDKFKKKSKGKRSVVTRAADKGR
ncbi:MAG: DEAD/DEAH box helicase, partial [Bacteroidota bacterium]|nr:DEAD/DEAH box helicase [Bacteroidota bacterium]